MRPFRAALFDMDGTILDSMGVWARVDEAFFAARGIPLPEDYAKRISGMTFRETGEYTRARFGLRETVDEILDEWNRLCRSAYENDVPLKPGARAYLEKLKREGARLAVATALPERLYAPALSRNGILPLFDAFASTEETGEGKRTGGVYLLAAKRLNEKPGDCAVFEDIYDGLAGAKRAGMRAYCVYDAAAAHDSQKSMEICDGYIASFEDLL